MHANLHCNLQEFLKCIVHFLGWEECQMVANELHRYLPLEVMALGANET